MEHIRIKRRAEQHVGPVVHVPDQLQRVRVGRVDAKDGACLEHELVGAEVGALQEDELILVREIQRAGEVLLDAEVEGLDALGGVVLAVVGVDEELGAAEARLLVEDGIVRDGDFGCNGVDVELAC